MRAVVVIPIYKNKLSVCEKISLAQVDHMLNKRMKFFIAPENLSFDYENPYRTYPVMRFPDFFFKSRESYSRLLLEPSFYQSFIQFDYMLVYQLDAFVFSDRLDEFCEMGVDFIGAPSNVGEWTHYHVGNGGFSLRKVSSCLRMVHQKAAIISKMSLDKADDVAEDSFFAFCGNTPMIDFNVPSAKKAAQFSAQLDYAHGIRDIAKRGLPFGCHYWPSLNYSFWKPRIECFGYHLPEKKYDRLQDSLAVDRDRRRVYLAHRYLRRLASMKREKDLQRTINEEASYCIWGAGHDGEKALLFYLSLPFPVKIDKIYDSYTEKHTLHGIPICRPSREKIMKKTSFIVVATRKHEQSIVKELSKLGLKEGKDFASFFGMTKAICRLAFHDKQLSDGYGKVLMAMQEIDNSFLLAMRPDRKALSAFLARFPSFYLYGAGHIAQSIYQCLSAIGFFPKGVIVSTGHRERRFFHRFSVHEWAEIEVNPKIDGIILAVGKSAQDEILSVLTATGNTNNVYILPDFGAMGVNPVESEIGVLFEKNHDSRFFQDYSVLEKLGKQFGTDKRADENDFLRKYEFFLKRFCSQAFNFIEMGVYQGASIKMWHAFFPKACIYGVDISSDCLSYEAENIHILIGDISEIGFLKRLGALKPHVVIDDASHNWGDQILALFVIFPYLASGGIYIIEDIITSFSAYASTKYADAAVSAYEVLACIQEVVAGDEPFAAEGKSEALLLLREKIQTIAKDIDMMCFMKSGCLIIKK